MSIEFRKEAAEQLEKAIPAVMDEVVEIRRHLHRYPEIGFDTQNTEKLVIEKLEGVGIEILQSKMGVLARIEGRNHDKMVLLRADMDALCLQEENHVPYRSQYPNKMHACGHDGHTAMLLGAAKVLQENRRLLPMDVLLMFQPAEEGPNLGGARVMLADMKAQGLTKKIVNGFSLHVMNNFKVGTIYTKEGAMSSSTDEFNIEIIGRGGHAGQPHKNVDALSIGAKVINSMESFMSRKKDPFDPAVFSVGIFQSGSAINIVAETAKLAGTIRCQRNETREYILENMEQIVKGICLAFGADYHIDVVRGLPPLLNDGKATEYAMNVAAEALGADRVFQLEELAMGAEDFAYVAEDIPSTYLWLGSRNEEKGLVNMAHHPKFDFDEDAMETGIKVFCNLAVNMQ